MEKAAQESSGVHGRHIAERQSRGWDESPGQTCCKWLKLSRIQFSGPYCSGLMSVRRKLVQSAWHPGTVSGCGHQQEDFMMTDSTR